MLKLQKVIDKTATIISSILLGIMVVILIYNVAARFLGGGIRWYMEGSQYLNVWAMFIAGIGICVTTDHLRISLIEDLLKGKIKFANKIIVGIINFSFYCLLTYGTYLLASKSRQEISTMPPLKMSYVYWLMPVASALSAISVIIGLIVDLNNKDKKGGSACDSISHD
ncbi:MAG TPA: TRAP transporter small permease [Clostridiaceae bacterium]|nr:TRAP transporter small permease [Clostridiaceae bacterium]